jgi:nitrogen fixation NifU-like protein
MEEANRSAEGYNPLCGDKVTIFLLLEQDVVRDVSFQGSGCAICIASASVMTEMIKNKSVADVEALFGKFHELVTSPPDQSPDTTGLGKLAVFAGVREFPVRIKCATLPWHTLQAAMEKKTGLITTEHEKPEREEGPGKTQDLRERVVEMISTVYDPEIPVNIYELGLIYSIDINDAGEAKVVMTLTSPGCPVAGTLPGEVENKVRSVEGITDVNLELVWDPPWTPDRMSEAARLELNM